MLKDIGTVVLKNSSCYQDFIRILLANDYGVEIEPVNEQKELSITIKEKVKREPKENEPEKRKLSF